MKDRSGVRRRPAAQLSDSIAVARVMCILGIVYVHAWTGLPGPDLALVNDTPQGMLRWGLMELLGRSAVPLLSVISGWLVMGSVTRRSYGAFVTGKARTVLAPMVLWNALAILIVSGAAYAGLLQAPKPDTLWWTIDELFCLATPNDINVQMSFLRDLFICMLAAPALARLPGWAMGLAALAALVWAISGVAFPLVLRPTIPFFFIVGMLARRHDLAERLGSAPILLTLVPYLVLATAKVWFETVGIDAGLDHPVLLRTLDVLMRFTTALFFWAVAWRVAVSRAAPALLKVEPYVFLMFCWHLIMVWVAGPAIGKLSGPLGSPLYPAFLLVQPLLVLAATVLLGKTLLAVSPTAALWLSGGRLSAEIGRPRTA
ncbi:MAG TPA: acyltransferase [Phenylobacterium sp.]|uniref:acyltransferase family protein n=1 Tax=Phenylobacterium sp. TaxID=1871053 RepID=UPI002F923D25